ncbi:hypothetical protein CR513_05461, partial [Mucuna pruriens]
MKSNIILIANISHYARHLKGYTSISQVNNIFNDDDDIDSLLSKPSVKRLMFMSWKEANKIYYKILCIVCVKICVHFYPMMLETMKVSLRKELFGPYIRIRLSRGQSLASVGLYLPKPVFSHEKIRIEDLIHDKEGRALNTTTNVVFQEVFQNL